VEILGTGAIAPQSMTPLSKSFHIAAAASGVTESMWSQKRCEAKAASEADGMCRRRTVWENQTHMDRLLRGLIARLIAAIARY
jgi:hypothetical protein